MRILVCGNYGRRVDPVNGQTIKTRVLTDFLQSRFGRDAVSELDTSFVFHRPWSFYRKARAQFSQCSHAILLPGPLAAHVLLPLFVRWQRRWQRRRPVDVRYVVIGGWLPDVVRRWPHLLKACRSVSGIYVETSSMVARLNEVGLGNVHLLPNFRLFDPERRPGPRPAADPLKLVFCARVVKEKGVEEAVTAVEALNRNRERPVAELDVFGPVAPGYDTSFAALMAGARHSRYQGVLTSSDIYGRLGNYDLMLFPTYYPNEGFPGTILDAFVAGVPVIASDWKYNSELVEPGRTGTLCQAGSSDDLVRALNGYVAAPQVIAPMREFCFERALGYHVDTALRQLLRDMTAAPAAAR